jgi:Fe2+ transport system protein FeoA
VLLNLIPLELLERGEWAEVENVLGETRWVSRMEELGLRAGARLRMLQPGCPCLFQLGDTSLSLRLADTVEVLVRPLGVAACAASEVA